MPLQHHVYAQMRENGISKELTKNSLPHSESCPPDCEQMLFRQLTHMYTCPSGQINSCDYCTQNILGKKSNSKQSIVLLRKLSTDAINRRQLNILCISLQLFQLCLGQEHSQIQSQEKSSLESRDTQQIQLGAAAGLLPQVSDSGHLRSPNTQNNNIA